MLVAWFDWQYAMLVLHEMTPTVQAYRPDGGHTKGYYIDCTTYIVPLGRTASQYY